MEIQVGGEGLHGRDVYQSALGEEKDLAEWTDHLL